MLTLKSIYFRFGETPAQREMNFSSFAVATLIVIGGLAYHFLH